MKLREYHHQHKKQILIVNHGSVVDRKEILHSKKLDENIAS